MKTGSIFIALSVVLALCACGANTQNPGTSAGPARNAAQIIAEIRAEPVPAGVDADVFKELKAALIRSIEERFAAGKVVSAGPPATASASATLTIDDQDQLLWYYTNPGDYDQNGVVNVSDLTPIGMYYNESGPFEMSDARSVADGDQNGEINVNDVTPIGVNFGNTITGYNIYSRADLSATSGATVNTVGSVSMDDAITETGKRKWFSHDVSAVTDGVIWAFNTDGTTEGAATTVSTGRWKGPYQILPDEYAAGDFCCAHSGGYLAIAYIDPNGDKLMFVRATTLDASEWGSPVELETGIDRNYRPAMAVSSESGPYIIYFKDGICMQYMSTNAEGTNWLGPFERFNPADAGTSSVSSKSTSGFFATNNIQTYIWNGQKHIVMIWGGKLVHVTHGDLKFISEAAGIDPENINVMDQLETDTHFVTWLENGERKCAKLVDGTFVNVELEEGIKNWFIYLEDEKTYPEYTSGQANPLYGGAAILGLAMATGFMDATHPGLVDVETTPIEHIEESTDLAFESIPSAINYDDAQIPAPAPQFTFSSQYDTWQVLPVYNKNRDRVNYFHYTKDDMRIETIGRPDGNSRTGYNAIVCSTSDDPLYKTLYAYEFVNSCSYPDENDFEILPDNH